jgi:hypothetical protein
MSDSFLDLMDQYGVTKDDILAPSRIEPPTVEQEEPVPVSSESELVDKGGKLKKKDLYEASNLRTIRRYMVSRRGIQYNDKSDEDVVEDFMDHMRSFNTNIINTGGEVRHITNASQQDKAVAGDAYKLYDQLGNVFVNDGFYGAVDGVFDYIQAAATDPSNYIGLLTGGLGKAASLGITKGGKELVRQAAIEAGQRAAKSGATSQGAKKAADEAAERVAQRIVERGIKGPAAKKLQERVALQEQRNFIYNAKKKAQKEFLEERAKKGVRGSLLATTGIDGSLAMLHDNMIQNVMLDAGAQEEYSMLQTGFSSALGLVGGGAQLVGGKLKGVSGLKDTKGKLVAGKRKAELEADIEGKLLVPLSKERIKKYTDELNDALDSWEAKRNRGDNMFQTGVMPSDFLKTIMVGEDGKGGVAKLYLDEVGRPIPKNVRVTDVMTNTLRQMPEDDLQAIAKRMQPLVGYTLGDTTEIAQEIGDYIASNVSRGMTYGAVMSQVRSTIDSGLVAGHNAMINLVRTPQLKEQMEEEILKATGKVKRPKLGAYTQSVWRRLLISSPATTGLNVAGFSQFYVGSTLADVATGSMYMLGGLATGGKFTKTGSELLRKGKVFHQIQAQKMRNLMDPYTTHDAYMDFLSQNKDIEKVLFESVTGGIERSGRRFDIDPDAKWFKGVEAVANGANRLTGVRVQDTFTKSQMFMTELDKRLRLKHDRTLTDVLNSGNIELVDDSVVGGAIDTTLKSVFSKDYTTDDQLLRGAAKLTESISNIPLFGTVLPFGRFFNNVVATSYQWSVGGGVQLMSAIAKSEKRNVETLEAASRSLVGLTAISLAMNYDKERSEKGLDVFEIEGTGGAIIDARNTFPFSLWLAAGRIGRLRDEGEAVPKEMMIKFGEQVAVGQLATDLQFGNDITRIMDTLINQDVDLAQASFKEVAKFTGNYAAGFTRPLDAVNKLTGYVTDTDAARDIRQAETGGQMFTQGATRYFDNVIEAITDRAETVSGEELRVASRQGKVQDANPMARIFGITVKPARTATEQAYSMANMQDWTASERTSMAAYDTIFNEAVAPELERATDNLLRDRKFINADLVGKRAMLKSVVSEVKKDLRKVLKKYGTSETKLGAMRAKASEHGNKELRSKAMKAMKERYGFEGGIRDMTITELHYFMDYVDYLKDYYK